MSVWVHVGLLFEPVCESTCPLQGQFVVVDAEEQEQPVARRRRVRAHQRGMLVRAPAVEAKQDGSIRIQDLAKVVMVWSRLGLAEERLVPFEAAGDVAYADDCPDAFHRIAAVGLTYVSALSQQAFLSRRPNSPLKQQHPLVPSVSQRREQPKQFRGIPAMGILFGFP